MSEQKFLDYFGEKLNEKDLVFSLTGYKSQVTVVKAQIVEFKKDWVWLQPIENTFRDNNFKKRSHKLIKIKDITDVKKEAVKFRMKKL